MKTQRLHFASSSLVQEVIGALEASCALHSFCELFRPGGADFSSASFACSCSILKRNCKGKGREDSGILEHLLGSRLGLGPGESRTSLAWQREARGYQAEPSQGNLQVSCLEEGSFPRRRR